VSEHELKTDSSVFQESWVGKKRFEIRLNDRNFNAGDTLILKETLYSGEQMKDGKPLKYTGREIKQNVDYVLHGGKYGLSEGWVIMSVGGTNRTSFNPIPPGEPRKGKE